MSRIVVSLPAQTLALYDARGECLREYRISTAKNGAGERRGSYCTPRGRHLIRARIGAGAPENTVFVARRPTGEIWSPALAAEHPGRDWMLTRILWLSGCEPGRNRLGEVDTMRRYIYIHGSPDSARMGEPGSIGCVRMANADIIDLFDRVPVGTRVDIDDFAVSTGDWSALRDAAAPLRTEVFVGEQGVPAAIEMDANDIHCVHALAVDAGGAAIGTGRLLPDGHIGRMAVRAPWRRGGVGRALLLALLARARDAGHDAVRLNAQIDAVPFYLRFGFVPEGPQFIEAGIVHQAMVRAASRATEAAHAA